MRSPLRRVLPFAAVIALAGPAFAQTLTFQPGTSQKVQQVIGGSWNALYCSGFTNQYTDQDWQTGSVLLNRTHTDAQVDGCDMGCTFEGLIPNAILLNPPEHALFFLNGDTLGQQAQDAMAISTSRDPLRGLALSYLSESNGGTFVVGNHTPGVDMGINNVPEAGITIGDDMYVICSTGYQNGGQATKYSVITHFSASAGFLQKTPPTSMYGNWDVGETISTRTDPNGGHFIHVSLVHEGDHVWMFGEGNYRQSDIYLAKVFSRESVPYKHNGFWNFSKNVRYFAGIPTGTAVPKWVASEDDPALAPVVQDDPSHTAACFQPGGTVGNISVQYEASLKLWLMTYDGGRQEGGCADPDEIGGIYFTYAPHPWGPWATPQLIFNATRDLGFGNYIANPPELWDGNLGKYVKNPYASAGNTGGPLGPMIGWNGDCTDANQNHCPCYTVGGVYAPFMIGRFNQFAGSTTTGGTLTIYYTMSTWNPYTVLLMESTFTFTP
jgi:hypothetical protein